MKEEKFSLLSDKMPKFPGRISTVLNLPEGELYKKAQELLAENEALKKEIQKLKANLETINNFDDEYYSSNPQSSHNIKDKIHLSGKTKKLTPIPEPLEPSPYSLRGRKWKQIWQGLIESVDGKFTFKFKDKSELENFLEQNGGVIE